MSRTPQEEANLNLVLDMFADMLSRIDSCAVYLLSSPDYV